MMKTQALKQALDQYGFDAAFGGARRDEEKSRAKERIFSFRSAQHRWDPKNQRPELWQLYNARKHKGESIRVFPLSNWTELDIWQYIYLREHPDRAAVLRGRAPGGRARRHADHGRRRAHAAAARARSPMMKKVRFRTLGCYPLTGAIESEADTLPAIIQEMLLDAPAPSARAASSTTTSRRRWRRRSRRAISDGPRLRPDRPGHRGLPARSTSTRACCASSPAAAWTTARAR